MSKPTEEGGCVEGCINKNPHFECTIEPPQKSNRQEKMEYLADYIKENVDWEADVNISKIAQAALVWVMYQLPPQRTVASGKLSDLELGYNRAIHYVRKNLGVE